MSCLQLYVKEATDGTWDHPICPNFWCLKHLTHDDLDQINMFDHDHESFEEICEVESQLEKKENN
jgi:hypothetical protein